MRPNEDGAEFLRHRSPVTLRVFVSDSGQEDLAETAGAGEYKSLIIQYPLHILRLDCQSDVPIRGDGATFYRVLDENMRTELPLVPIRSFWAMNVAEALEDINAAIGIQSTLERCDNKTEYADESPVD